MAKTGTTRSRRLCAATPAAVAALFPAGASAAMRGDGSTAAPAPVLKAVRSVPAATLDAVRWSGAAGHRGNADHRELRVVPSLRS
jgi:hypothetical protein